MSCFALASHSRSQEETFRSNGPSLAEQVAQEADGNPTMGNGFSGLFVQPLVLVCGAKWKRPVKLVYGIGRKGNGAICAPNRQNESSPIGSIGLWSGLHFAPQTSTSAAFLKGDKKRGDGSGDDPWEDVPRSTVWLAG